MLNPPKFAMPLPETMQRVPVGRAESLDEEPLDQQLEQASVLHSVARLLARLLVVAWDWSLVVLAGSKQLIKCTEPPLTIAWLVEFVEQQKSNGR